MHQVPDLPYAFDALEPYIDARTMEIHHDRHHAAYVGNLNKALEGQADLGSKDVEDLLRHISAVPESIRGAVRNNGGGHANHSLFWRTMGPNGGGRPSGELATAIDNAFGSFESFQEKLTGAAVGQFGSGWGWLVHTGDGLAVYGRPNQDSPLMDGHTPLVGVDVWEHAYYLHYQNKRADYVKAWWNTLQWDVIGQNYAAATR